MWKIITKFAHILNYIFMKFSAQQIASFLGGEVVGNNQVVVSNLSKIEEGKPGTLTFLANPKYTHHIYETQASIVLVRRDFEPTAHIEATLIKVDDPYSCLTRLLELVESSSNNKKGIEQPIYVAETTQLPDDIYIGAFAYVGERVTIGKNVKIYPQVYIGNDVVIGDDVTLYPGVKIYHGCQVGNRSIIHAGTVIGSDGFGFAPQSDGFYKKIPQIGVVIIEEDVEIGANTTIDRATMGATIIHKGVKLDNLIQIAHNVEIGEHSVMAAQVGVAGSTKIGKNCMFGGQVGLVGHLNIGNRVQLGAKSGITNSIKDDMVYMGYPAVPKNNFSRQTIYTRHLPELNDTVKRLQREIEELKALLNK